MTIKVYANYEAKVITEKEFLAKIEKLATEYDDNLDAFENFLNDTYNMVELLEMTEEEKIKVKKFFHEINVKDASEDIREEWIETILEI